jgi:large subunit ribosomal protein L19
MSELIKALEAPVNEDIPELRPGDDVSVHLRIREGERERIQEFRGTIIRLRKGGNDTNFTVRRIASHGIGVERTFLLRSPRIAKVEVVRHAHVRRARLYYLRDRRGKRARLPEKRG